jgi:hypothetical protein
MDEYLWVLKKPELDLVREIEPERMAALDEDELIALHKRVRQARNKHVGNYRRKAAKRVAEAGGRGAARPGNKKSLWRAEAFEEALSRVSQRLAEVAHEQSEALKNERLARAQEGKWSGPETAGSSDGGVADEGVMRTHTKTTGGLKRDASSQAQGAKRQAQRDSRGS